MSDVLVTLLVLGSLPFIFRRPSIGVARRIWIGVLNPHSQGGSFARTVPFAATMAATVVVAMPVHKPQSRLPAHPLSYLFLMLIAWISVTSLFALRGVEVVEPQWFKGYKIFGITAMVMMPIRTRQEIAWRIWVVVVLIGYYGVKGGIFTLRSGGNFRLWGPEGTFIDGNNEVALAWVIVTPLMYYLMGTMVTRGARIATLASMLRRALASLGSYSRGAALAIAAMSTVLWLKSRNKHALGLLLGVAEPLLIFLMPSPWHERIDTIHAYQDASLTMGRMAFNLANDRLLGGSFEIVDNQVFARYAPMPLDVHAAHSIYFQLLGEHGWLGLLLYVAIGVLTWRTGSAVVQDAGKIAELAWAPRLATMLQVSLIGFAVGGAFLSLLYFEVPYLLMGAMVATRLAVARLVQQPHFHPACRPGRGIEMAPVTV